MRRISCHRGVRYCLAIAIALFALATPCRSDDSQNKTAGSAGLSFAGKFANEKLTLELHDATDGYAGTIALGNNKFNATAKLVDGQLTGSFDANGTPFKFTATRSGDIVTMPVRPIRWLVVALRFPLSHRRLPRIQLHGMWCDL